LAAAIFLVVLLAAIVAIPFWVPLAGRWWQCQQLAPIERLFTRGC